MVTESVKSQACLQKVVERFAIKGLFAKAYPYGSGHIHDTYLVEVKQGTGHRYVLQKINRDVFTNIPAMMHNIQRVTEHMNEKASASAAGESDLENLVLLTTTQDSRPYFQDPARDFWRVYNHIPHVDNPVISKSPKHAFETGKAFGGFLSLLSDFPVLELHEAIPEFHVLPKRLQAFDDIVRADPVRRVSGVVDELEFVRQRRSKMAEFFFALRSGGMRQRVTHNDTKSNNVLFNESGRSVAVVDLDTVMPGYVHYDFGDAIRTIANQAEEDETNLDKVLFDITLFENFARGYLRATKSILSREEVVSLPFSARFMTFLIGLRFLTDYIDGDRYYKVQHSHHNLQRARAQFKLLASMEEQAGVTEGIIDAVIKAAFY